MPQIDELVWYYDEPFADPSALPTYQLCRKARQHMKVALSGDGSDEVLAGYRRYGTDLMEHKVRESCRMAAAGNRAEGRSVLSVL